MPLTKPKLNRKVFATSEISNAKQLSEFDIRGKNFVVNLNGNFSMTELWKMLGSKNDKRPFQWLRWKPSKKYIEVVERATQRDSDNPIIEIIKGRSGGTFAHPRIFLAYAKWLSPELHDEVNDVFLRARSGDMSLVNEIIDSNLLNSTQKMIDLWGVERAKGKLARLQLTGTLLEHGVDTREGFAQCTNALYRGSFGGTAQSLRDTKSLMNSDSLRDNMNKDELATISIAEILATRNLEKNNRKGVDDCAKECQLAGILSEQILDIDTRDLQI